MKIIKEAKLQEGFFQSSQSSINKFFSAIEKAADILDDSDLNYLDPESYLLEYAKLFGSYVKVIKNTLEDYDNVISMSENSIIDAFKVGFKR